LLLLVYEYLPLVTLVIHLQGKKFIINKIQSEGNAMNTKTHLTTLLLSKICLFIMVLMSSGLTFSAGRYEIIPITSDNSFEHKWPSINNNGHIVWSQRPLNQATPYWQITKCNTLNNACVLPLQPVTSDNRNHLYPVIDDNDTIVWVQDDSGPVGSSQTQVVRQDSNGQQTVVELSTYNSFSGAHRDAGEHIGISSDGHTISYYDFFGTGTRRFNISGFGEVKYEFGGRGDFFQYDYPDINKDLTLVYSNGTNVYKATTVDSGGQRQLSVIEPLAAGTYPRIADGVTPEIVFVKGGNKIISTQYGEVTNGTWADVTNTGDIVFEKNSEIFLAKFHPYTLASSSDQYVEGTVGNELQAMEILVTTYNGDPVPNVTVQFKVKTQPPTANATLSQTEAITGADGKASTK